MDLQSLLGYSKGSPYANNPYLDIFTPEGLIDMSNTPMDLMGIDNLGNKKKMKAGRKNPYKFDGSVVREIPIAQEGMITPYNAAMRGMMRGKIATGAHFNNPSAQRMVMSYPPTYIFKGNELDSDGKYIGVPTGESGTHYMGSYGNEVRNGIQNINGEMQYIPSPSHNSKENIRFDTPEQAEYFAKHYKDIAPMMKKYQVGGRTLLRDKKVGEITAKVRDFDFKNQIYRGPMSGTVEKEGCPEGVGCSEQVTDYIANDMGIDRNLLSPQHAAYRSSQFQRDGATELFNPYPKGTKINTSGYGYSPLPKEVVANLQYGDYLNLDHGDDEVGISLSYDKPAYMKPNENNDVSHWGVVVGRNAKGEPLIRHGWAGEKNKGQFTVEPLTPDNNYTLHTGLTNRGKDFRVATAYRPKSFANNSITTSKPIIDKAEDIATRKQKTTSGVNFYLGNTDEEKLIRDLPVAAEFSGANVRLNTKKKLEGYLNNKDMDNELKYSLGITQTELDNLKPVVYGIAGQETTFGHVGSVGAAGKDIGFDLVNSGVNSKGLFQINYNSLTPEERKVVGINSPNDLLDDTKAYKASILMMKNAKTRVDREVAQGTHPELVDKDPYFRAAYYYNSPARAISTAKEWAKGSEPTKWYNPNTWANGMVTRERSKDYALLPNILDKVVSGLFNKVDKNYAENAELRMDEGSYPYKLMERAKDLKQYINPDESNPVNLEEVVVRTTKSKNKTYKEIERLGGNIYKQGGMSREQILSFLYEDEDEKAPATAPAQEEVQTQPQEEEFSFQEDDDSLAMQLAMEGNPYRERRMSVTEEGNPYRYVADLSQYGEDYKDIDKNVADATKELLARFPNLQLTSGRRDWGDKDAHPLGRAVDLSYDEEAFNYYQNVLVPKYGFNKPLNPNHGTGKHIHLGYY